MMNQRTLNALLAAVAKDIVDGVDSDVDLHYHPSLVAEGDEVVAILDRLVREQNCDLGVEQTEKALYALVCPGPALYCQRVDRKTGATRLFFIGPYTGCLTFTEHANPDRLEGSRHFSQDRERRARLLARGEDDLSALCQLLESKLRARLNHVCMHVDVRRTATALLELDAQSRGRSTKRGAEELKALAAVCRATNVSLVELLTEPEWFS
jgi:hypothetical protein